jgi:GNAT superfamily N-acetyltransferase
MIMRQATGADVNAAAQIMGDWCEATPYIPPLHTRDEDRQFMQKVINAQDVLVAETADEVQGFIARDQTEIGQFYLAPSARGQGTGTALIAKMKTRSDQLWLWCFQANTRARRFYERQGFVADHMTDGVGNEENLPDIRYVWRVRS